MWSSPHIKRRLAENTMLLLSATTRPLWLPVLANVAPPDNVEEPAIEEVEEH